MSQGWKSGRGICSWGSFSLATKTPLDCFVPLSVFPTHDTYDLTEYLIEVLQKEVVILSGLSPFDCSKKESTQKEKQAQTTHSVSASLSGRRAVFLLVARKYFSCKFMVIHVISKVGNMKFMRL